MTLEQYIKHLQGVVASRPESKNYIVVYAEDDEGNGYGEVGHTPEIGYYDGENFSFSQDEDNLGVDNPIKAVCIN